jgi:hypothetical protein
MDNPSPAPWNDGVFLLPLRERLENALHDLVADSNALVAYDKEDPDLRFRSDGSSQACKRIVPFSET